MMTTATPPRPRSYLLRGTLLAAVLGVTAWLFNAPAREWWYLKQAEERLDAGDPEGALVALESARKAAPDSGEVAFGLARAHRKSGQLNQVHDDLEFAHERDFDEELVHREWLLTLAQSGRMREAEPELPELLRTAGDDGPEICEAYVLGYQVNFRFDAAAALLDAWEQDWPESPRPHALRGAMAQMATRWPLAVDEYRRAIELGDASAETHLGLAVCLTERLDLEEALPHFQHAVELDPRDVGAQRGLADCLMKTGRHGEASRAYARVLELDADDFDAQLGLAKLDLEGDRADEALARLEPLLETWPGDADALYTAAQALLALDRREDAQSYLAQWEVADAAVQQLEQSLEELRDDPANVAKRYDVGVLLLKHYSRPMGERYLLSVLQLAPQHVAAHAALAEYYSRTHQPQLAAFHAKQAGADAGFDQ